MSVGGEEILEGPGEGVAAALAGVERHHHPHRPPPGALRHGPLRLIFYRLHRFSKIFLYPMHGAGGRERCVIILYYWSWN